MKLQYYSAIAAAFLLSSCSADEPGAPESTLLPLNISISDGGFSSSRSYENDLTTIFTAGDRIGLFAVRDGAVFGDLENICLTAVETDGNIQWVAPDNITIKDVDDLEFFAYYPYQETLPAVPDFTSTSSAEEMFRYIITSWIPETDQSEYSGYTASDLMIAKGTKVEDNGLSFSMHHMMARVSITFPSSKYVFTNEPAIPDYILEKSSDIYFDQDIKPMVNDNGEYIMIVNPNSPDASLSGSYMRNSSKRLWKIPMTMRNGTANTYNIDAECNNIITHHLQIGDYFLSDGTLLSKEASGWDIDRADVVGIVYCIDPERIGEAEHKALGGCVHGAVMATKEIEEPYPTLAWCTLLLDESEIGLKNILGDSPAQSAEDANLDISGLERLEIIKEKRPDEYASDCYEAFHYASEFGSKSDNYNLLKVRTTGWYLPATGQWFDIVRNLGKVDLDPAMTYGPADLFYWKDLGPALSNINEAMSKVAEPNRTLIPGNRWYWTATNATDKYAYYICITDGINVNSFSCFAATKSSWTYCRPVLAF